MKKLMTLVLAVVCVVSLFGCAAAGHENEIQTPNAPQEDLLANNRNTPTETTENPNTTNGENKDLSEIPGAKVHVVDIWDQTAKEPIFCASALEKFWEDETNEYYFACIKSDYIMVMDSTGRIVDVVTALEEGLITVEDLDTYCIGYTAKPKSPDTTTEEVTNDQELPLTIVSNEKTIIPYFHFAFSGEWNGTGFISADGSDLISVLEDLETDGLIPCLEYSQDFDVILGDGVTTQHILLFDEAFNQLDTIWDIADLSKLDAGNYYVGMIATKEGKYIEEVNMHEYVGWACVVQLTIKFD